MPVSVPENNKRPGVYYAFTDDGLELPVIDVTHPAFAITLGDSEIDGLLQEHIRAVKTEGRVSKLVRPLILRLMAGHSRIMRGLLDAAGGFLSGMNTYILKLGPDNMGTGYASDIDRQISRSIAGISVRLRLQNVAQLLARGLQPMLSGEPGQALHLLNIGGGPAIDSLNALIILRKQYPGTLAGRSLYIHSLDIDESGPNFGRRALAALQSPDAPLHGLDVSFEHIKYNWSDQTPLSRLLHPFQDTALIAGSSEGALFEYGSDEEVGENLHALHEDAPASAIVVGSVTRADEVGRIMNSGSRAALKMRGVDAFTTLARSAGWMVARRIDRPSGHDVLLEQA